jgi:hypothetical protein
MATIIILLLSVVPRVTHEALYTCTALLNSIEQTDHDASTVKQSWLKVLSILETMPPLRPYWETNDAAEVYGMW